MKKNNWLCRLGWISALLAGVGCTSVEEVMKTDTTMKDVIFGSSADLNRARDSVSRSFSPTLSGYTRDALNETDVLFSELPNPRLAMYVYPHLTPDNTPIPGYTVPLYFYDHPEYAMPGEAFGWE
jgi:conjugative transfer region lipoprotein (TIGR03751 family)